MVADFETTTGAVSEDETRVWAWGLVEIENAELDTVELGNTIDSFMERMQEHNATVYFHNLKFDGWFMLDWLLNNGFKHVTGDIQMIGGEFKSLISDMGKFYSITVRWRNGHSVEFRDSLKKLPMNVARIAKSFGMDMEKGDLDYDAYRAPDHVITDEEASYIKRDVLIVAKAMQEVLAAGMKKLTVASDSLAEYKRLTKNFDRMFPVLDGEMDAEIRRAYRGGFTYADERFKGRMITSPGVVLDVNSLYPSVMMNQMIPYDEPIYSKIHPEPTTRHPLTIFSVTFTAKLKPNHIPCIQIKGSSIFTATEYLKEITEPTTLMVTNVDWELYNAHYDIQVYTYGGGWSFKAAKGMFDNYINKWGEIKAKEAGGKREIAKLHLNSLYGKFATNPNVTSKNPVLKDGVVRLVRGENETRPPVYTAAGVFITSFARDLTIRAAQANYDSFAYADTDSLHLIRETVPESINVHPTELGAWKFEYGFTQAFYIRAKAYMELTTDGEYVTRIAGLPLPVSTAMTFDDLVEGKVLHGKLNPKAVRGGVILQDVPFELKLS